MLPASRNFGPDGLFPKKPEQSLVRPYTVTATTPISSFDGVCSQSI